MGLIIVNKLSYFTLFIILLLITIITLLNPYLVISSVVSSTNSFIKNLFPSLLPFLMISFFLIEYNVIYYIGKFISKIFKIDNNVISLVLLSMLSGFPSNAKYINDFVKEGIIDKKSANVLVGKTFFPGPMFVLGTIGILYLNDYKSAFIILISIYLTNFILLFNFKFNKSLSFKRYEFSSFGSVLSRSINSSIFTLFIIMGSIVLFSLILDIIKNYLNIPLFLDILINMFLEMSSASKKISTLNLSTNLKSLLIALTLTFGGFCIHSQMLSILPSDFSYKIIFLERIKALIVNFIVILLLFSLSYICYTNVSISIITSTR